MKNKMNLPIYALILLALTSMKYADDILQKLGLDMGIANQNMISNLTGVSEFKLPYVKTLPEIIKGDKVGAANELCAYVKQYCESTVFADDYNKIRERNKPDWEPEQPSEDEVQQLEDLAKMYDEWSKDKTYSKDQRAEYQEAANDTRKLIAEAKDPTPNKTKWEKDFPKDPALLVKKGLEEYLALVETVDFSAKITEPNEYKISKFVNPNYESKSYKWKAIYRAGKEVNVAVTEFTKQWLAAGIKTGQSGFTPQTSQQKVNDTQKITGNESSGDIQKTPEKQESLGGKTKGLIKSLKDKVK